MLVAVSRLGGRAGSGKFSVVRALRDGSQSAPLLAPTGNARAQLGHCTGVGNRCSGWSREKERINLERLWGEGVYQPVGWSTMNPSAGDTRVVDQRSSPLAELCAAVSNHSPATFM